MFLRSPVTTRTEEPCAPRGARESAQTTSSGNTAVAWTVLDEVRMPNIVDFVVKEVASLGIAGLLLEKSNCAILYHTF